MDMLFDGDKKLPVPIDAYYMVYTGFIGLYVTIHTFFSYGTRVLCATHMIDIAE